jgi:hypothetical protein
MAPQQVEKIEFAPGNGRGSEAANPLDVVKGARLTVRDSTGMTKLQKKAPMVLKSLDAKLKSAPVAAGTLGELVGEGSSARLGYSEPQIFGAHEVRFGRLVTP